jgi:hypothetical protein
MAINTSAGTTIGISASLPATYDATGFDALTYTLIGEVSDIPEYGAEHASVNFTPLASAVVKKFKGSRNNGSTTLALAYDKDDAGRALLVTALNDYDSYSFEVTLQGGTDKQWFTGKVMSLKTNVSNADAITTASCMVDIDSDIVENA